MQRPRVSLSLRAERSNPHPVAHCDGDCRVASLLTRNPVRFGVTFIVMAGPVPAIVRPQACNIREVQVPFRNTCFRPVADRNCVIARWCGEQREANGQSVVTRTRFGRADWRASDGKAKPRPAMSGKPATLTGQVTKRSEEAVGCLETESPEGDAREVERPARQRAGDVCQVE